MPFYLFVGEKLESKFDSDTITSVLLDSGAGTVNSRFADYISDIGGIGGYMNYYYGYRGGVKMVEAPDGESSKFKYSPYASVYINANIPIDQGGVEKSTPVELMTLNLAALYSKSDYEDYQLSVFGFGWKYG